MTAILRRITQYFFIAPVLLLVIALAGTMGYAVEKPGTPQIICENNLVSVSAVNVRPEVLFTSLSKACKIEVVAHGKVFPETPVTIQFNKLPLQEAVKRLVKASAVRSYVLDLQGEKSKEIRRAKLELFVSGNGERVLTESVENPAQSNKAENPKSEQQEAIHKPEAKTPLVRNSGNNGDGSTMPDFPKYTGEIPFDKSSYTWQGEAKDFARQSMDSMPPAVREGTAEAFIRTCDEIAREKGSDSITVDITSAALERLARRSKMPPELIKNLPKSMTDMNKPR
jgi:hypothetical protein